MAVLDAVQIAQRLDLVAPAADPGSAILRTSQVRESGGYADADLGEDWVRPPSPFTAGSSRAIGLGILAGPRQLAAVSAHATLPRAPPVSVSA
jgi:hypothetical protein